jgi:rhodanese-related sulfurtransferase
MSLNQATRTRPSRLLASLGEAGAVLLVAVAAAALLWIVRPDRLSLRADPQYYVSDLAAPLVTVAEARELYEAGSHAFVDTRPGAAAGGIPGAFRVREDSFADDLYEQRDFLFPEDPLILYGDGNIQQVSAIAARLQERGFADVQILRGGLSAWRAAGGPVIAGGDDS